MVTECSSRWPGPYYLLCSIHYSSWNNGLTAGSLRIRRCAFLATVPYCRLMNRIVINSTIGWVFIVRKNKKVVCDSRVQVMTKKDLPLKVADCGWLCQARNFRQQFMSAGYHIQYVIRLEFWFACSVVFGCDLMSCCAWVSKLFCELVSFMLSVSQNCSIPGKRPFGYLPLLPWVSFGKNSGEFPRLRKNKNPNLCQKI